MVSAYLQKRGYSDWDFPEKDSWFLPEGTKLDDKHVLRKPLVLSVNSESYLAIAQDDDGRSVETSLRIHDIRYQSRNSPLWIGVWPTNDKLDGINQLKSRIVSTHRRLSAKSDLSSTEERELQELSELIALNQ